MLYQSFLIKYAEIGTKGKNRFLFEDALIKQIKHALRTKISPSRWTQNVWIRNIRFLLSR